MMTDNYASPLKAEETKPVKDNPAKQGELPRKRDDSQDDRKDPFKAS
ncbi:hypothetical protein [Pseudescherichia sp.]|nr:hypothetical protein [Pseudescherichia sp.]